MKFLHAADIHLDSPLAGLGATAGAPLALLRDATRRALSNMVERALEEKVDFVVIAGDLYDGDWRDYATGLFFVRQMARLAAEDIPVFIALGNHDADSRLTRQLTLPENVTVFRADRAHTVHLRDHAVALHGRSFPTAAVNENLALAYPRAEPGLFNIGVLHTAAGGREAHLNYAPCSVADLIGKGYDYWALGHVHAREILHEHPHIVFPGNLQGRHIRETGTKGFTLVRVEEARVVATDHVAADVVRWSRRIVDLSAAEDFEACIDVIADALAAERDAAEDRFTVVRLILDGATPAHSRLVVDRESLVFECHAAAARVSDALWVEKVSLATRPHHDIAAAAARPDAIGALLRSVAGLADDAEARAALASELGELATRMPDELKRALWRDGRFDAAELDAILAAARGLLAGRILDAEEKA